jgi:hypothetical protein
MGSVRVLGVDAYKRGWIAIVVGSDQGAGR